MMTCSMAQYDALKRIPAHYQMILRKLYGTLGKTPKVLATKIIGAHKTGVDLEPIFRKVIKEWTADTMERALSQEIPF